MVMNVYTVLRGGEEPLPVAAQTARGAIETAAQHWGISRSEAAQSCTAREPSCTEIISCCHRLGVMPQMIVRHPEHPAWIGKAYCKWDALMFAASEWDVPAADLDATAEVGASKVISIDN